jgi:GAF domain-containing protein
VIIHDAYADERFQKAIDLQTGYTTSRILCVPLRTLKGDLIGVAQLLNKEGSEFTEHDLKLLEAIVAQAAVALESHRTVENLQAARRQELEFLDSGITLWGQDFFWTQGAGLAEFDPRDEAVTLARAAWGHFLQTGKLDQTLLRGASTTDADGLRQWLKTR